MKKNLFNLFVLLCLSLTMASCISDDDNNTQYLRSHFVIEGVYPNYTLYSREDITVYLDPTSVASMTNKKGFGDNKRGYFDISFKSDDVSYVPVPGTERQTAVIKNAQLIAGSYVTVSSVWTYDQAEKDNITVEDSVFNVQKISDFWMQRGYLNIAIDANYSVDATNTGIFPTTNVAYKRESVRDNEITLTVLYNRHSRKDATTSPSVGRFITAYYFPEIAYIVPGNDSIRVKIEAMGTTPVEMKIGR